LQAGSAKMEKALHVVFAHALVNQTATFGRVSIRSGVSAYELADFVENILDKFADEHFFSKKIS
jgi:hypothetical protein